jgi:hypothetical protein
MWGYPYTLWVFLIASIWFMVDALINQPKPSLIALGITLLGIPFYFGWRRKTLPVLGSPSQIVKKNLA